MFSSYVAQVTNPNFHILNMLKGNITMVTQVLNVNVPVHYILGGVHTFFVHHYGAL